MKRRNYPVFLGVAIGLASLAVPLQAQFGFLYAGGVPFPGLQFPPNFNGGPYAYSTSSNGALTLVPGSPFGGLAGITGIAAYPGVKFLYAAQPPVDGVPPLGSILAYGIEQQSGALTPVPGSPFAANLALNEYAVIAVHPTGKFAYVTDYAFTQVLVYSIDSSTGALTPLQQLPVQEPSCGSCISGVSIGISIDPAGKFLYANNGNHQIFGFAIDPSAGTLTPVPGSPFTVFDLGDQPPQVGAMAIHPSGRFLYVTDGALNTSDGQGGLVAYAIDPNTGTLTPVPGSPFAAGNTPSSVAVDPAGKFVYVATDIPPIASYSVDLSTGSLTPLAGTDLTPVAQLSGTFAPGFKGATLLTLDCTGRFLDVFAGYFSAGGLVPYVVVFNFNPQTGALTQSSTIQQTIPFSNQSFALACPSGPLSSVSALPAFTTTLSFQVQWSGFDGLSTISDYTIYVSDNGSPFTAWLTTTATQAMYTGVSGHTYGFYSIARDVAGNVEMPKTVADATTLVDTAPPVSHVSPLPATETSSNFLVQWSGTDPLSGIQNYTIYVSDNGGPFNAFLTQTAATQAWYVGFLGHTYGFFSQAVDKAGNVENLKTVADATTQTPATSPEDVNGDGQINCADVDLVKASFGKKTGQAGFNAAADVNKDGVVNVLDLALVTQKLIPGTACQ